MPAQEQGYLRVCFNFRDEGTEGQLLAYDSVVIPAYLRDAAELSFVHTDAQFAPATEDEYMEYLVEMELGLRTWAALELQGLEKL